MIIIVIRNDDNVAIIIDGAEVPGTAAVPRQCDFQQKLASKKYFH